MALDGLVVRTLVNDLQFLTGGRINKIHQPGESEIVLQIRARGSNAKLLLSANPTIPRAHLTESAFLNPLDAPMFCMLLRKHCESGIIQAIRQPGMERIIHIEIVQKNELGDMRSKTILVEIMGRHSNIIVLDTENETVLDGIHHVTPALSAYRVIMPGSRYMPPPEQNKLNPEQVSAEQFMQLMQQEDAADLGLARAIVGSFSGISPLIAEEIVFRSGLDGNPGALDRSQLERLWHSFNAIIEQVVEHRPEPQMVEADSGKSYFSVVALTHLQGRTTGFSTVSKCLEAFYGDKAEKDAVKQRTSDLQRHLQNEKSKNEKKLEKLRETVEEANNAERFRVLGELLTAHMHQISKGEREIEVINYYDEQQRPVIIELDPQLSPSENAQRYFKKYTKSKNSLIAARQQIQVAQKEIRYLENLLHQLAHATLGDIEEIREELSEQGYVRQRRKKQGKAKKPGNKPLLHCYTSSEGIPIYVGKNNLQNEYLTNRLAHASDTWLHTKDIPGSHVVIRSDDFGEETLEEAAQLAAYFSQARSSSQVPVDMTLIRHVRKPNGAKPGFVIYDHQKTLFITPDEQRIKQLSFILK